MKELRAEISKSARSNSASRALGPSAGALFSALETVYLDKPLRAEIYDTKAGAMLCYGDGPTRRSKIRRIVEWALRDGVSLEDVYEPVNEAGKQPLKEILRRFGLKEQPPMPPLPTAKPAAAKRSSHI
ncbi:hypothetical protein [Oleiharenicola sp. Vm1]|uniref:hypothetical protein n=1 Tax=Oleiharenicola sp. Vm1 TaxID=3398393 RepID=UPI0039F471F1